MQKSCRYRYFQTSYKSISQNKIIIAIIFFFEYYIISIEAIKSFSYGRKNKFSEINISSLIRNITSGKDKHYSVFSGFSLLSLHVIYIIYIKLKIEKFPVFFTNYFEIFYIRFLAIIIIDVNANIIVFYFIQDNIFLSLCGSVFEIVYIIILIFHIKNFYLLIIFDENKFYPFDYITMHFDLISLLKKFVICFQCNLYLISPYQKYFNFLSYVIIAISIVSFVYYVFCFSHRNEYMMGNYFLHRVRFGFSALEFISFFFTLFEKFDNFNYISLFINASLSFVFALLIKRKSFTMMSSKTINPIKEMQRLICISYSQKLLEKYVEIIAIHVNECFGKCEFCEEYKNLRTKKITNHDDRHEICLYLFLIFLAVVKKRSKNKISIERCAFDILDISYDVVMTKKTNMNFVIKTAYIVKKYKELNFPIAMNIALIYYNYYFSERVQVESVLINEIRVFLGFQEQIQRTINQITSHLETATHFPSEFIKTGEIVHQLTNSSFTKFLFDKKRGGDYLVQLIKFIIESIKNSPLNNKRGPIRESILSDEYAITHHFFNCKNIVILLRFSQKAAIIKKAGRDLLPYVEKNLFSLFPKEIYDIGVSKFEHSLNDSSNDMKYFDFYILRGIYGEKKDYNDLKPIFRIAKIEMSFKIMYQDINDEFFITGDYHFDNEEFVMTRIPKDENILNTVKPHLLIPAVIYQSRIPRFKEKQIEKNHKAKLLHSQTLMSRFVLNELIYGLGTKNNIYKIDMNFSLKGNSHNKEIPLTKIFKKRSATIYMKNYPSKQYIIIQTFETESHIYKVYSTAENVKKKNHRESTSLTLFETTEENSYRKKLSDKIVFQETSSIANSCNSQVTPISTKVKKKDRSSLHLDIKYQQYKNRFSSIMKITLLVLFVTVIISFMSFIVEMGTNEKLLNSYSIYTEIRKVNRSFYNLITSVLSLVCIGIPKTQECINYYKIYSANYNEKKGTNFDVFSFSVYENEVKVRDFVDSLFSMKKMIIKLNDENINNFFGQNIQFSIISLAGKKINVVDQENDFFQGLELIKNSLIIVTSSEEYTKEPVYIFSLLSKNFDNFPKDENENYYDLKMWQVEYYNIVMNHYKFLKIWIKIQEGFNKLTVKKLSKLDNFVVVFLVLLFMCHWILFFVLFYFVRSFEHLFMLSVEKLILKIENEEFREYFKKKYELLAIISKFYLKNPIEIINQMTLLKNRNAKKLLQLEKSIIISKYSPEQKKKYHNIIKKFYFQTYIFIFYYIILSIALIFVWKTTILKISSTMNFITENTIHSSAGYSVLSLIQLMILGNQTEYDISKEMNYQGDKYLKDESYKSLEMLTIESKKKIANDWFIGETSEYYRLSCDDFFYRINDAKFQEVDERYPEEKFGENFKGICNSFHILDNEEEFVIYKVVFYELNRFIESFHDWNYEGIHQILLNGRFFFSSHIQFLIFRPFRTWYNNFVLQSGIDKSVRGEKTLVFTIVGVTVGSELVTFLLIYLLIFLELKKINIIMIEVNNTFKIQKK